MTSDAKVGLLLGLAFIFAIAFIINGLPSLRDETDNNELTTKMLGPEGGSVGLAERERKAGRAFVQPVPVKNSGKQTDEKEIRFAVALPSGATKPRARLPEKKKGSLANKSKQSVVPKAYVVEEGDNLAVIAKKFYGPTEGDKEKNVARIFEANRKVLSSPDEIYVGQKISIPALSTAAAKAGTGNKIFSAAAFEKVKSIGERHVPKPTDSLKADKHYVVQEGDSLWRIAAEQLAEGIRYREIAELNANILDNQDNLVVGMRLRMPAR